jgi:hypothetical protein
MVKEPALHLAASPPPEPALHLAARLAAEEGKPEPALHLAARLAAEEGKPRALSQGEDRSGTLLAIGLRRDSRRAAAAPPPMTREGRDPE